MCRIIRASLNELDMCGSEKRLHNSIAWFSTEKRSQQLNDLLASSLFQFYSLFIWEYLITIERL